MAEQRCHTFQGVHIPGCYGCANHGDWPHSLACSCPPRAPRERPDPETAMEKRLKRLETKMDALIASLEARA